MQNDNMFNDMDRMMRSMLQDAEVKAPRRVRRVVFARLAAASGTGHTAAWARPAVYAFACAAAVALGVFFSGTFRSSSDIDTGARIALIDNPQVAEPTLIEDEEIPEAYSGASSYVAEARTVRAYPADRAYTANNVIASGEDIEDMQSFTGTVEEEKTAAQQEPQQTRPAAAKSAATKAGDTEAEESARAFADMRLEDYLSESRRTGRVAAFAKGAISGNDSDIRFSRGSASMAPSAGNTTGISELSESVYGIPFSLGVGVRAYITPRLSAGIGLDYSLLTRTFTGKYTKVENAELVLSETGSVQHNLQYIGIPLNLYYDIIGTDKLKFYTYAGVETEFAVSNKYTLFSSPDIVYSAKVEKPQYSVGLGFGLEFALTGTLGLYIDPGVRYYFHNDQPKSVRTDKPLLVSFDAGLRFNF